MGGPDELCPGCGGPDADVATTIGDSTQSVGTDALLGLPLIVRVVGACDVALATGRRVQPGACGVGEDVKYDDGLRRRPFFFFRGMTARTPILQSAHLYPAAAFAAADDE